MAISPARKVAFEILQTVERKRAHSDDLLRTKSVSVLSPADRHLATALVLGVLRWQIWLDAEIRQFLDRPGAKLDAEIRLALRLGAFQILRMERIPAHAAIDESVELAKDAGHRFAARMVNAVLRKVASAPRPKANVDPVQAYPSWMTERWQQRYGSEALRAMCAFGLQEPQTAIRLVGLDSEKDLLQAGIALEPGKLLTAARVVTAGDVPATEAFQQERVRFQDEGSQLVGEIAGHGNAILDCCAAPGGKTLLLAERNPQARIVACEASPQRLGRLRERLAPLGERVECRQEDAGAIKEKSFYDLVLADVPCSGTGTLGRNPEIRHRLKADDFPRQAERQMAILRTALQAVRPGGRVVYSTCSLEREENEAVVEAILREQSEARVLPLSERIEAMMGEGVLTVEGAARLKGCVSPEGHLRLMPGAFGSDGFFVALLSKN
jgi:16S rRNA (cytosine967-C5)-methyltransferase